MSVRPTQTKSGYPRRSRQPFPSPEQDLEPDPDAAAPVESDPELGGQLDPEAAATLIEPVVADPLAVLVVSDVPADPVSRVDRRSQRAARRARHHLAIAVAVLVAVCLILTILIVNMARNRPSGLDFLTRSVPTALSPPSTVPDRQTRDTAASEGGNR